MPTISPTLAGTLSVLGGAALAIAQSLGTVPAGSNATVYIAAAALALAGYFHLASPPTAGPLAK